MQDRSDYGEFDNDNQWSLLQIYIRYTEVVQFTDTLKYRNYTVFYSGGQTINSLRPLYFKLQ